MSCLHCEFPLFVDRRDGACTYFIILIFVQFSATNQKFSSLLSLNFQSCSLILLWAKLGSDKENPDCLQPITNYMLSLEKVISFQTTPDWSNVKLWSRIWIWTTFLSKIGCNIVSISCIFSLNPIFNELDPTMVLIFTFSH